MSPEQLLSMELQKKKKTISTPLVQQITPKEAESIWIILQILHHMLHYKEIEFIAFTNDQKYQKVPAVCEPAFEKFDPREQQQIG